MVAPPRAVLFDAGGTLVQLHVERLAAGLSARGHDPHELDDAFWATLVLLDDEFGPDAGAWDSWFSSWLDRMADTSRVPRDVMVEAWKEADAEAFLWDQPIDGALECLTRIREAGMPVGVVSNADGRIDEALARAGLRNLLDVVVDSGVVGVAKPDPAIFAHALDPLGVQPEEAWYLGDTVRYDAAAADAAGLVSWVVDHKGLHTAEHPRRVSDLYEFADVALAETRDR